MGRGRWPAHCSAAATKECTPFPPFPALRESAPPTHLRRANALQRRLSDARDPAHDSRKHAIISSVLAASPFPTPTSTRTITHTQRKQLTSTPRVPPCSSSPSSAQLFPFPPPPAPAARGPPRTRRAARVTLFRHYSLESDEDSLRNPAPVRPSEQPREPPQIIISEIVRRLRGFASAGGHLKNPNHRYHVVCSGCRMASDVGPRASAARRPAARRIDGRSRRSCVPSFRRSTFRTDGGTFGWMCALGSGTVAAPS